MNILIYYQNAHYSVFIESVCRALVQQGHSVFFLSMCQSGELHDRLARIGVNTAAFQPQTSRTIGQYMAYLRYFIAFCRKHQIELVFSHLQLANLIALIGQYFIGKAKVLPTRHHQDDVALSNNKNAIFMDKAVDFLAKKIIVLSNSARNYLLERENVAPQKIAVVPLGYDFDLYGHPDPQQVQTIRTQNPAHLLLVAVGRMTPNKRYLLLLRCIQTLRNQDQLDIKLLLVGNGPDEQELRNYVHQQQLGEAVIFVGFLPNVLNHLAAADLLIHPSCSEASNQVVKEAAWAGTPSLVCKGVGDFDEYLIHNKNALIVDTDNAESEICQTLKHYYHQPKQLLQQIAQQAKSDIVARFSTQNVMAQYQQWIKKS